MKSIYDFYAVNDFSGKMKCISLIYDLLSFLLKENDTVNIINHSITEPLNVKNLASTLHISHAHLTKIFHEEMGISPKNYIISKKLERACELLTETSLSVSEISNSVGVDDPMYFSRIFKKKKILSPSEYRKKYKKH